MTRALKDLLSAHRSGDHFPYLDFVGAFLVVEEWIRLGGERCLAMLNQACADDLLGIPLGHSTEDLKLGFVLELLRSHGQEVFENAAQEQATLLQ